ncbi:MAG: cold shock domain-containing protein [candidate division Zixibacteria bacterium]|nr:cold shock domain-containing protein [candidate division Zixibacteria bacterium]
MNRKSDRNKKQAFHQGTVKFFDDARGYGFIIDDDSHEVFVHHSAIRATGHRTLIAGDRVEFEIVDGPKGLPQAGNVRKLDALGN